MLRMDETTLRNRIADVERALIKEGLSALIVFGNGSALGAGSRSHGYLRYLCNWDGHNTPSLLILIPGRQPQLLTPNVFLKFLGEEILWFNDVHFVKPPSFGSASREALEVAGMAKKRIGIVGRDEMTVPIWGGFTKELPEVEWVDFTSELDQRRVVKDSLQLAFHRRAAEICDGIFETLTRQVRSGQKTYQIQAEMERTAKLAGAEYILTWLTIRPIADYSRFYKEECLRVPQPGDQILAGIYLIYDGNWGHAIRMGTYGKPTSEHRHVFDIALEMEEAGLAKLRPGGNLFDVNAAFEAVLERHYPNAKQQGVFCFRAAHGLGYSYEDPISSGPFPQPYDDTTPSAPPDAFLEIKEGMLFEFHPNLFVPKVAGAAIGDMVAVTSGEPEIMTHFPRQLIEW